MKHSVKWRSPSNIALVKYWGKYPNQIPANPSISFTLSECFTETEVELLERKTNEDFEFEVLMDGRSMADFKPKIRKLLSQIVEEASFLQEYALRIKTRNSFPHSSGIASSASGMSALALCLLSLKQNLTGSDESDFLRKASKWARLGSGSASRSVYGKLVEWGRYSGIRESSDEHAVPYAGPVDEVFTNFRDYVLLVETGSKQVSSTVGHSLMARHPYAERRFLQAHENLSELLKSMGSGDLEKFGSIVESEALTLHAMMMTSQPYFILMKPNTLRIVEEVWQFRKDTKLPLYFTLDAGANLHLLFPEEFEPAVNEFVKNSLTDYLKNAKYICDLVGQGPAKIE